VLDDTIEGDGKANQNGCGYKPLDLLPRSQALQSEEKYHDVRERGIGSLQALVRAEEADSRGQRGYGAYDVCRCEEEGGED
jgi:hypothetical protein